MTSLDPRIAARLDDGRDSAVGRGRVEIAVPPGWHGLERSSRRRTGRRGRPLDPAVGGTGVDGDLLGPLRAWSLPGPLPRMRSACSPRSSSRFGGRGCHSRLFHPRHGLGPGRRDARGRRGSGRRPAGRSRTRTQVVREPPEHPFRRTLQARSTGCRSIAPQSVRRSVDDGRGGPAASRESVHDRPVPSLPHRDSFLARRVDRRWSRAASRLRIEGPRRGRGGRGDRPAGAGRADSDTSTSLHPPDDAVTDTDEHGVASFKARTPSGW